MNKLWTAYYENDVATFRQLLERRAGTHVGLGHTGGHIGSPSAPSSLGASPVLNKTRKSNATHNATRDGNINVNTRDANGLTILHHAASSISENALAFADALVQHIHIDLHLQDHENGWTSLHRAFYFGNISIARLILEREAETPRNTSLIKIKDREGHGPLDLYSATIRDRTLREESRSVHSDEEEEEAPVTTTTSSIGDTRGDEVYTFGSNRNVTLGFGDEDDRQFPERITLRRPESLIQRFHREYIHRKDKRWSSHIPDGIHNDETSWDTRNTPLVISDVQMSKLHTAVLTADPESNLFICGHGQGGRLGTGDERTRYQFVCIPGKKFTAIALGQNHTLAISEGEIYSWGSNGYGQLGYSLPKTDGDPFSTIPRQIFGVLKRETIIGVAASRTHSVAFTSSSLYTFGKNDGQLGIVDSDARSLEIQTTPRKVAASQFSAAITSATCIDKATVCLLENHEVWVFANYGYTRVAFDKPDNSFLKQSFMSTSYDTTLNRIVKITSAGDTVCALSSRGEIFTVLINQLDATSSTTNPAKIRNAIAKPQCVWSSKWHNMAARDVGVDADGSIILSTEEGSVWKRTKRAQGVKDYKFSRIPGLTRVLAVRASAYGAYAAIRRDCDVTKTQIAVAPLTLWKDISALSPFKPLAEPDQERLRFWTRHDGLAQTKQRLIESKDIESELKDIFPQAGHDAILTTSSSDLRIPIHRWLLTGRSRVLRRGFRDLCETSTFTIEDMCMSELEDGQTIVKFAGIDILTLIDLALYLYTDSIVDFWHIRNARENAYRYRQIRVELMKIAGKLELIYLEPAVRQMIEPQPCLDMDLAVAYTDPAYFFDGDILVQLEDGEQQVHSTVMCARCPFFSGLFAGRAGGRWLAGRDEITVDLAHINSTTFNIVLQYIYSDDDELFDSIVANDLDEYFDIVMDVLSAANELMLDRLSQICQVAIGRYVNARNVCWLLNAISPSSVRDFKHAALEYLCLNLEAMLQGHLLNELEEDLLEELDEVVRQNQLNCLPFAKSQRAEIDLLERHPELAERIEKNRRAKLDAIRLRSKFDFRPGSIEDDSPMQGRRPSSQVHRAPQDPDRPMLKPKASTKDMIFAMDEEPSPTPSPSIRPVSEEQWYDSRGKSLPSPGLSAQRLLASPGLSAQRSLASPPSAALASPPSSAQPSVVGTPRTPRSPLLGAKTPPSGPWTLTPLPTARSDFKNIMAQASGPSSLSQGIENARSYPVSSTAKMSQKDRKKLQHQQVDNPPVAPIKSAPWQTVSFQKVASLKDVISESSVSDGKARPGTSRTTTPQLTLRQTLAHAKPVPSSQAGPSPQPVQSAQPVPSSQAGPSPQPVQSPQPVPSSQAGPSPQPVQSAQPAGLVSGSASPARSMQQRSASDGKMSSPRSGPTTNSKLIPLSPDARPVSSRSITHTLGSSRHTVSASISPSNTIPQPRSVRHEPRPVEPALQLSISDIVAQQQLEKDIIREAVAKRDLHDIQAEQEFEEWWQKESARIQEAERTANTPKVKRPRGRKGANAPVRGNNKT